MRISEGKQETGRKDGKVQGSKKPLGAMIR